MNTTDDYILIQSWIEDSKVVFGLYGTKPDWTVKVTPGQRTDVQKASTSQVVEGGPRSRPGSGWPSKARWTASRSPTPGWSPKMVRSSAYASDPEPLSASHEHDPGRRWLTACRRVMSRPPPSGSLAPITTSFVSAR